MPAPIPEQEAESRRAKVLVTARWCFLNFGFSKTTLDDIARRSDLSRTLLYRMFKDKEEIFQAVFVEWLLSRHPAAKQVSEGKGSASKRLLEVCRLMVLEPWAEMAGAPMAQEFFDICGKVSPESEALFRKMMLECVVVILGDPSAGEVFLLSLDGLFADHPSVEVLSRRTELLVSCFTANTSRKGKRL